MLLRTSADAHQRSEAATVPQIRRNVSHYRPEVDGLRALAVLAVILCHAQIAGFTGGYIGVDVFFVISGFVVTGAIAREQHAGAFSLATFYARRLRRLAPALYCMLGATVAFALAFLFPEDAYDVLKNSLFVGIFYSNIFLGKQTGYFDPTADKQALLHTWSLSVEEQFYLAFPLLLVALRRASGPARLGVLACLFAASLAYSQHAVGLADSRAYYMLHTRAFEFLIGVLLAFGSRQYLARVSPTIADALLLCGLAVIVWCVTGFEANTPMPGIYALIPCLGAALVIAFGERASRVGKLLTNRAVVYAGKLSYTLYLWHWPVLFALRRFHLTSDAWTLVGILFCAGLAMATHHWIEEPIRRRNWTNRKTALVLFVAPVCALGCLLPIAKATDNFAAFYPKDLRASYEQTGHSVFQGKRADACWNKVELTDPSTCWLGQAAASPTAIYWGDSHAYHLVPFIDQLGKEFGLSIHDVTLSMCPPIGRGPARAGNPAFQAHREECLRHNEAVFSYVLAHPEINHVIMAAVWQGYVGVQGATEPNTHGFLPGDTYFHDTVAKLLAAGKRVVLLDDVPIVPAELENFISNRLYGVGADSDCTYAESRAREDHKVAEKLLADLKQQFPSISIVHTYDVPCDGGRCQLQLFGVALYRHNDTGHLGQGGSEIYYRAYRAKHSGELEDIFGERGTTK